MVNTKERPIALTAQEVNAVLAGDKTQHRVSVLTAKEIDEGFEWDFSAEGDSAVCIKEIDDERQEVLLKPCPFGAISDRLWVQEFHARREFNDPLIRTHYYADGPLTLDLRHDAGLLIKYAAENMPRWASRLLLEITDIRIERIQDISESDALASGLIVQACQQGSQWFLNPASRMKTNVFHRDEWHSAFSVYWDSLHGVGAWDRNDWVWVYDLKKANN